MTTDPTTRQAADPADAWWTLKQELEAAREAYGWDDPRTLALEDAEAEAFERHLAARVA